MKNVNISVNVLGGSASTKGSNKRTNYSSSSGKKHKQLEKYLT
jgi:hypothetical protein